MTRIIEFVDYILATTSDGLVDLYARVPEGIDLLNQFKSQIVNDDYELNEVFIGSPEWANTKNDFYLIRPISLSADEIEAEKQWSEFTEYQLRNYASFTHHHVAVVRSSAFSPRYFGSYTLFDDVVTCGEVCYIERGTGFTSRLFYDTEKRWWVRMNGSYHMLTDNLDDVIALAKLTIW